MLPTVGTGRQRWRRGPVSSRPLPADTAPAPVQPPGRWRQDRAAADCTGARTHRRRCAPNLGAARPRTRPAPHSGRVLPQPGPSCRRGRTSLGIASTRADGCDRWRPGSTPPCTPRGLAHWAPRRPGRCRAATGAPRSSPGPVPSAQCPVPSAQCPAIGDRRERPPHEPAVADASPPPAGRRLAARCMPPGCHPAGWGSRSGHLATISPPASPTGGARSQSRHRACRKRVKACRHPAGPLAVVTRSD